MKNENKHALIIAFYLSKFDAIAYQNLALGNKTNTHKIIGANLNVKPATLKNMRDQFDPFISNTRQGWHQTEKLAPSRQKVWNKYNNLSEPELRRIVLSLIQPNSSSDSQIIAHELNEIYGDDKRAIEGERVERRVMSYARNSQIAAQRKQRDQHTCQGCGFSYEEQIVECHHLVPLSEEKASKIVTLDDLITLCPTCHRLAHKLLRDDQQLYTQRISLVQELRKIHCEL